MLLAENERERALDLLQAVLDSDDPSFVPHPDGGWESTPSAIARMIRDSGPETIQRYVALHEDEAGHALQLADQAHDPAAWGRLARRLVLTPSGREALNRLGTYNLDLGRGVLARHYFNQWLEQSSADDPAASMIRAKRDLAELLLQSQPQASAADHRSARLRLGGRVQNSAEWFARMVSEQSGAAGAAQSNADDPTLDPRELPLLASDWSLPLTESEGLASLVDEVMGAAEARRVPLVLGFQPLVLDGRIHFRNMDAFRVIDRLTGDVVADVPTRATISGELERPEGRAYTMPPNPGGVECTFVSNQIYGSMTTDGERIYFVDELPLNPNPYLPPFANQRGGDSAARRGRNGLSAVDAKTLKVAWSVASSIEPTDERPEADANPEETFYLAPPTPTKLGLFVLAESRSEIFLHCLDPATGKERWRMLLTVVGRGIDADIFRRSQSCTVVEAEGLLICPTNLFRTIAVDPATQTRIWDHASPAEGPLAAQYQMGMQAIPPPVATHANDAPIVDRGQVILTEPLGQRIRTLDLQTGKTLWQVPREGDSYVAAVSRDLIVMAGPTRIRALKRTDGTAAWATEISLISGRGIRQGNFYLVPGADGTIRAVNMRTGTIVREVEGRERQPIGTLVDAGDRVLAISSRGLESFPRVGRVRQEIDELLAHQGDDPVGLYRRAQLRLASGEVVEAIADLRNSLQIDPQGASSERSRDLLFAIASREALRELPAAAGLVSDLARWSRNDDDRGIALRLHAEYLAREGKVAEILDLLRAHRDLKTSALISVEVDDPALSAVGWAQAFVHRQLKGADLGHRTAWTNELERELAQATKEKDEARLRELVEWLPMEAIGARARLTLARQLDGPDLVPEKEYLFLTAARSTTVETNVRARVGLIELMEMNDRPRELLGYLDQLEQSHSHARLESGETVAHWVETKRAKWPEEETPNRTSAWNFSNVNVQSETSYRLDPNKRVAFCVGSPNPFFRDWQLVFDQQRWTLEFHHRLTGKLEGKVSKLPASLAYQQPLNYRQIGSLLLFEQSDTVYAISGAQRRLIWHRRFDDPNGSSEEIASATGRVRVSRLPMAAFAVGQMVWPRIIAAGPGFVLVQAGRHLTLLDPWTGESVWTKSDLRQDQLVAADDEYALVYSQSGQYVAHRLIDGKPMTRGQIEGDLRLARGHIGRRILLMGTNPVGRQSRMLRAFDPVTKTDYWRIPVPFNADARLLGDEYVVIHDTQHRLKLLDAGTGKVLLEDEIPVGEKTKKAAGLPQVTAFSDGKLFYLAAQANIPGETMMPVAPSNNVRLALAHGWLRAYDRTTFQPVWHRELVDRSVIAAPGEELPFLVTVANRLIKVGNNASGLATSIELIDKRDGKTVFSREHGNYATMLELAYALDEKWLELRGYNLRLRLQFLDDGAQAPPAAAPKQNATSTMMQRFLDRAARERAKRAQKPAGEPQAPQE